ncbi:MAG: tail fiber domain-containing protein [Candidatus Gastranaerophilales bacterium]|nr:tail fiber domain-containing protein [Candidatus Gastranaerophilales bacterium]MCM1073396.1 tail fiber domain-containing protein [Bacteroides sp.]
MKRLNGFSLMEMMIVLTIVAIVAAASAPMVNKKMVRAASDKSPWIFVNESESIAYNLDNPNGIQNRKTASIGARIAPNNEHPRLYIDTTDSTIPHIMFGSSGSNTMKLFAGTRNSIIISDNISADGRFSTNSVVIGRNASGANETQVIIGDSASSNRVRAVAIGHNATINGEESVAIGSRATVTSGAYSTVVGYNAIVSGANTIALGSNASANAQNAIAVGAANSIDNNTRATGNSSIAIGTTARSLAQNTIAIGTQSSATTQDSVAIGNVARATAKNSVAIGTNAYSMKQSVAIMGTSSDFSVSVGHNSVANSESSVAIGSSANAARSFGVAVGQAANAGNCSTAVGIDAKATGQSAVALGSMTNATQPYSIAIGDNAKAEYNYAVALGRGAIAKGENQIVLGDKNSIVYIPGKLVVNGAAVLGYHDGKDVSDNDHVAVIRSRRDYKMEILERDGDGDWDAVLASGRVSWSWADVVKSDRRLKNVGKSFTSGLDKLKQLEVFNYTYKEDKDKTPHVGVMAQDLQKIFPDAVRKGEDGFLRIRMEDMFYAVINAVKELDSRVSLLEQQQKRINELEKRIEALEKAQK